MTRRLPPFTFAMLMAFVPPLTPLDTYPKNPGIDALNYAFGSRRRSRSNPRCSTGTSEPT